MKTFWAVLVAVGIFTFLSAKQYEGTMVSRGIEGSSVNMRNRMQDYDDLVDSYENKTGHTLTPDYIASNKIYRQGNKNGEQYLLSSDQVYTRFYHKPFRITGQVILKVRMPDNLVDYVEVSNGQDIYGIYFMDSLPPQIKGDKINVTGIVIGRINAGKTSETVLVSSYLNVSDANQLPEPKQNSKGSSNGPSK